VQYQCAGGKSLSVRYFNSDDNHLALLRVQGKSLLFVTTVAASGARYVAQQYEWWSKGNEGTLRDTLQGEPGRGGAILLGACKAGK
jgi:membrane-bound inhibitor of C-type lysozyme